MTNRLSYLGPLQTSKHKQTISWRERLAKAPRGFLVVVALPTLIAAAYFLLIASPRYVSEARFIVRAPSQSQMSPLGVALQGVGFSTQPSDSFAVHEYITSRDGVSDLDSKFDLRKIWGHKGIDIFSRYPNLIEDNSQEGLHHSFQRFVTVGYASQTGISTLRVEAFTPADAQLLANAMLDQGEALINRLNERASDDAVRSARQRVADAQAKLIANQKAISAFRTKEQFIDPARAAAESTQLIGGLLSSAAQLRVERSQLALEAPQSPQLPAIDGRIRAYEAQIAAERAKIAGSPNSLAPRVGDYETLVLQSEIADRELVAATSALTTAVLDERSQKLYLERIAAPALADKAQLPNRPMSILTVLLTCLLVYGVGLLVFSSLREHQQG